MSINILFLELFIINKYRDKILVDPILVGQVLAQKVPHNEFFVEYGLKNLVPVGLNGCCMDSGDTET